ncbi:hypothetical protein [Mobiluncus mulieris]|uniref:Uncharacterized protein n=1 Tax=Mobiluncus mulieris TaxID=2052 RepID=A0A7Y0UTD0_9ACTO|nr:hypothetical protein [Mobiluncus mulieris]NMX03381.1 hypothetical protein [Mobiluncus mulieris]
MPQTIQRENAEILPARPAKFRPVSRMAPHETLAAENKPQISAMFYRPLSESLTPSQTG